jgi:hypothetical protein
MAQQILTINVPGEDLRIIKNVSFQIKGPANFELVDKSGKILQLVTLNLAGTDGMSDSVYPYDVKDSSITDGLNVLVGACSSNYLKSKNPNY